MTETTNCPDCTTKQALINRLQTNLDAILAGATRMRQLLDSSDAPDLEPSSGTQDS